MRTFCEKIPHLCEPLCGKIHLCVSLLVNLTCKRSLRFLPGPISGDIPHLCCASCHWYLHTEQRTSVVRVSCTNYRQTQWRHRPRDSWSILLYFSSALVWRHSGHTENIKVGILSTRASWSLLLAVVTHVKSSLGLNIVRDILRFVFLCNSNRHTWYMIPRQQVRLLRECNPTHNKHQKQI